MKTYPKKPIPEVFAAMVYLSTMAKDLPFVFDKTAQLLGLPPFLSK